jgi:hypothetical protein
VPKKTVLRVHVSLPTAEHSSAELWEVQPVPLADCRSGNFGAAVSKDVKLDCLYLNAAQENDGAVGTSKDPIKKN